MNIELLNHLDVIAKVCGESCVTFTKFDEQYYAIFKRENDFQFVIYEPLARRPMFEINEVCAHKNLREIMAIMNEQLVVDFSDMIDDIQDTMK